MTAAVLLALTLAFAPGPSWHLLGGLVAIPVRRTRRARRPSRASPGAGWTAEAWGAVGVPLLVVVKVRGRKGGGR